MKEPDLTIRHAQTYQPWTVPYSAGVLLASGVQVPHILGTHTALHVAKTSGKLAAAFEAMDHPTGANAQMPGLPTPDQHAAIRSAAADLMVAALRLANLYSFDLELALVERTTEKNGRGFDPSSDPTRCTAVDFPSGMRCPLPAGHEGGHDAHSEALGRVVWHDDHISQKGKD